MKRKYKLHIMANDCPICGGALYKGRPCEACGFSWTAWKGEIGKDDPASALPEAGGGEIPKAGTGHA